MPSWREGTGEFVIFGRCPLLREGYPLAKTIPQGIIKLFSLPVVS